MSSTNEPYRIRLRGPWEVALIERDGTAAPLRFAYIPAEWRELFGERAGTGVFRRRFNRPASGDAWCFHRGDDLWRLSHRWLRRRLWDRIGVHRLDQGHIPLEHIFK